MQKESCQFAGTTGAFLELQELPERKLSRRGRESWAGRKFIRRVCVAGTRFAAGSCTLPFASLRGRGADEGVRPYTNLVMG